MLSILDFFDEPWYYDKERTFRFTTDDNIKRYKPYEIVKTRNSNKLLSTGYWTFICNPEYWAIDDFLQSGEVYDTFSIRDKSYKDLHILPIVNVLSFT